MQPKIFRSFDFLSSQNDTKNNKSVNRYSEKSFLLLLPIKRYSQSTNFALCFLSIFHKLMFNKSYKDVDINNIKC